MRVLTIVRQVEAAALEDETRPAGHATLRNGTARRTHELGSCIADLAIKVLEIVPVRATIVVSWH